MTFFVESLGKWLTPVEMSMYIKELDETNKELNGELDRLKESNEFLRDEIIERVGITNALNIKVRHYARLTDKLEKQNRVILNGISEVIENAREM